jgi:hypothetical protein
MNYARDISEIKVSVQRIESSMVTRAEFNADLKERVPLDVYQADRQGILDRLIRIESSPQRMIGWIGAVVGCLGILIAAAGFLFSVIAYFVTHQ